MSKVELSSASQRFSNDSESILRSRDGEVPSEGEAEGSANEAVDVETKRFGLSTGPSAAAESAFPEDSAHRLWFDKLTTLS